MTTRADMLAEIADDLDRSDTSAFTDKINGAIRYYQSTRFWFNESRAATFNTVAATRDYTFASIGTEFYRIDGVFLTVSADDIREMKRASYLDFEDDVSSDGEPDSWAYIAKMLRLNPPPDQVYSVRLVGHAKVAAPVSDTEADNPWMNEAYDLIKARAKAELYAHRYEDPVNASVMRQAEMLARQELLGATEAKVAPGRITPTEF